MARLGKQAAEQEAIRVATAHEIAEGRIPTDVSKKGVGHDIESSGRLIEVKGVGESWRTYNWQSLGPSEVECLRANPKAFYLYIVKFDDDGNSSRYIISGDALIREFNLKVAAWSLTPISQRKLKKFLHPQI